MAFAKLDALIAKPLFMGFLRQGESLLRDFHFASVAVTSDPGYPFSILAPALRIHGGECADRVLAKNRIEGNEGLEQLLPGSLHDIAESTDESGDVLARCALGIFQESAGTRGNLLQHNEL